MAVQAQTARATPEYTDGWARIVNAIRWLLVAVLVVDLAAGLLSQPRPSQLSDLRTDLTAGKVRSITFADHDDVRFFALTSNRLRSEHLGPVVLWRVGAVDYRVADLTNSAPFLVEGGDSQPGEGRLRSQIRQMAGAHGVPVHTGAYDLLLRFPQVGQVVFLLLLAVLLRSGQPRRATRWATFWLLLTPLSLGMLRTLVLEAPWSAAMRAWPEPPPHRMMPLDARMSGGSAFLIMLLSYIPVQLALAGLAALRG
jgi:hypothetical protein